MYTWRALQSRRVQLAAVVTVLLTWISRTVDSRDEPSRNAIAQTMDNDSVVDSGTPDERKLAANANEHLVAQGLGGKLAPLASKTRDSPTPSNGSKPETAGTAVCGRSPSSYRENSQFHATGLPRRWGLNPGRSQPGATLISTKRGPASNPSLCAQGCAVLEFTIPAGLGWGGGAIVDEWFSTATNLNGATVTAKVALELPRPHLPVNVRLFVQGDSASNYSWGTTASLSTPTLAELSSFHEIVLHPVDHRGARAFCASTTGAIGIQVQRSRNSAIDIPVKLYIKSVMVGDALAEGAPEKALEAHQGRTETKDRHRFDKPPFEQKDGYCRLADDGSISVAADDWVTAGSCQSYGYTYANGQRLDTKIVPTCTASRCTPKLSKISTKALCASGTIAADPTWKTKVGLGLDLDPIKTQATGIALSYQMAGTAIVRFLLEDDEGTLYCADLDETDENGVTVNLPWESLTTRCWDLWDPGVSYSPNWPIKGIQLSASCLAARNSWFDMCLTGLATF